MAWTTPRVWTGDARDRQIRDNLAYLYDEITNATTPCCILWHSKNYGLGTGVSDTLPFDTEIRDTDGMHDAANEDLSRIVTIQTPCVYAVTLNVSIAANSSGRRQIQLKHDATIIGVTELEFMGTGNRWIATCAATDYFDVGDEITAMVYQSAGSNLNVLSTSQYSPRLSVVKVG